MTESESVKLAEGWVEAYNRGPEWVDECLSEDVEYVAMPYAYEPEGAVMDFAAIKASAQNTAESFPDRTNKILKVVAQGDDVVLEGEWRGTAALTLPGVAKGDELVSRFVCFMTFKGDKIIRQKEFIIVMPGGVSLP